MHPLTADAVLNPVIATHCAKVVPGWGTPPGNKTTGGGSPSSCNPHTPMPREEGSPTQCWALPCSVSLRPCAPCPPPPVPTPLLRGMCFRRFLRPKMWRSTAQNAERWKAQDAERWMSCWGPSLSCWSLQNAEHWIPLTFFASVLAWTSAPPVLVWPLVPRCCRRWRQPRWCIKWDEAILIPPENRHP